MKSDEQHNNFAPEVQDVMSLLTGLSEKGALINFTYIAIQHNHGQVNFTTVPSCSKEQDSSSSEKS